VLQSLNSQSVCVLQSLNSQSVCVLQSLNSQALYLYDALMTYLIILNKTVHDGKDYMNDDVIVNQTINMTYSGELMTSLYRAIAFSNHV
jgi:hypothetical protein